MTPASPRSGKTSLLAIVILAAAAYGAGAASIWFYLANPAVTAKRHADKPGDVNGEMVVALGRIRPAGGIRSVAGPVGDQIAELLVMEGDEVRADQPLVRLASRLDRQDEVDILDQQIKDAETQRKLAQASGEGEIQVAKAKLADQNTLAPLDIALQQIKVGVLTKQRESAEERLRNMRRLQQDSPNTVAAQDLDTQELLVAQAVAEMEAGNTQLAKAKLALETGRKVAEAQLAAANANLQRSLGEIPLESMKKKRDLATLQLGRTILKAPAAGRVIRLNGRAGDPTAPQQTILDLADTAAMQVVAEVYETDVAKLRKMAHPKVSIRSQAFPKDQAKDGLSGTVSNIGTMIARNSVFDVDPTADTDRRVIEVMVTIDKPEDAKIAAQFLNLQVQVFFELSK